MFTNVIVGVDGNDGGRDATALAKLLCTGHLTLVGTYPHDAIRSRASLAGYEDLLRQDTERDLEATRLTADVDAELLAIADSSPARALAGVAEQRAADLLVLGSAHHGRFGRALLGDVGRSVIHDAPCPVAVAPKRFHGGAPRRIAVGYDGGPEAQAALDVAQQLASELGAALTVYTAWQDPPLAVASSTGTAVYVPELAQELREEAQALLDRALAGLPPRTAGHLLHGRPDDALVAASEDHDLMVVGSRRWGTAKRVALGSSSDRLVHQAHCAVLVIPRPLATTEPPVAATAAITSAG
jgi:nucleotide-binding universal stress UspA family protein